MTTMHRSSCLRVGRRCSLGPALCARASPPAGAAWCARTCAIAASRRRRTRRRPPTRRATSPPTPRPSSTCSAADPRTWPGPASAGWSSRWIKGEAVAWSAAAGAEILGDDPYRACDRGAHLGTARPAPHPQSRWPTRWAWCLQARRQTTLVRAPTRDRGPHAHRPRPPQPVLSRRQRRGDRPRDPGGDGCSSSRRPPLRPPTRRPARSATRSSRGRSMPLGP